MNYYGEEIWREIKGFNSHYSVSNLGRVRSEARVVSRSDGKLYDVYSKIMGVTESDWGYLRAGLTCPVRRKQLHCRVHRLVAEAFIYNPLNKPEVNHKDGNKKNNAVENLEWVTASENIKHSYEAGSHTPRLGKDSTFFKGAIYVKKEGVIIETLEGNADMISKGFTPTCVSRCLRGKQKTHNGCTFERP